MALHTAFPDSPHAILDPDVRWFPADEALREFLKPRLPGKMPKLDTLPYDGRIPKGDKLKRVVENLLQGRRAGAGSVE